MLTAAKLPINACPQRISAIQGNACSSLDGHMVLQLVDAMIVGKVAGRILVTARGSCHGMATSTMPMPSQSNAYTASKQDLLDAV